MDRENVREDNIYFIEAILFGIDVESIERYCIDGS